MSHLIGDENQGIYPIWSKQYNLIREALQINNKIRMKQNISNHDQARRRRYSTVECMFEIIW
jgi:hypothetical protein